MYYPGKDNEAATGSLIEDWGGLNRQYHIAENEWADMMNMSSRRFPLACPRERRTLLKEWSHHKIEYQTSDNIPKSIKITKDYAGSTVNVTLTSKKFGEKLPKNAKPGDFFAKLDSRGALEYVANYVEAYIYPWRVLEHDFWFPAMLNTVKINTSDGYITLNEDDKELYTTRMAGTIPGTDNYFYWTGKAPTEYTKEDFVGRPEGEEGKIMRSPKMGDIWIDYKIVEQSDKNTFVGRQYNLKVQNLYTWVPGNNGDYYWEVMDKSQYEIIRTPIVFYVINHESFENQEGKDVDLGYDKYGNKIEPIVAYTAFNSVKHIKSESVPTQAASTSETRQLMFIYEDMSKSDKVPPIAIYYKKAIGGYNWKRISSKNYDVTWKAEEINVPRSIPTGFVNAGAWIYSYTRFDGKQRVGIGNADISPNWFGYTAGEVDTGKLYWDGEESFEMSNEAKKWVKDINVDAEERRTIVPMGARVVLFPEKYYMNIYDPEDCGNLEQINHPIWEDTTEDSVITVSPCTLSGDTYDVKDAISDTKPDDPKNGQVWIDTHKGMPVYSIWDASTKSWNQVSTTYLKISCKGAFKGIKKYDSIRISGFDYMAVTSINGKTWDDYIDTQDIDVFDGQEINYKGSFKLFSAFANAFNNISLQTTSIVNALESMKNDLDGADSVEQYLKMLKKYYKKYIKNLGTYSKTFEDKLILDQIKNLNQDGVIVYNADDDYIVVAGILDAVLQFNVVSIYDSKNDKTYKEYGHFKFERLVPDLDYYCESNNRIWGCKFGTDKDGKAINQIYACKQGDPTNWQSYVGVSTDSYTLSIGSDGEWTGAINFNGCPTFFKQKYIYKIYGSYPASYQLVQQNIKGIGKGLSNSAVIVGNYLYYAASDEFLMYDGAMAYPISDNLGKLDIKGCISGTDMRKIYWVVTDSAGKKKLYVYDTLNHLWFIEECGDIRFMANDAHVLLYIERIWDDENQCYRHQTRSMNEDYNTIWYDSNWTKYGHSENVWPETDNDVEWYAETGDMGFSDMSGKYIQKISVRAKVEKGAYYNVLISYDGREFEPITPTSNKEGISTRDFVFRIHRCDYFRLKFIGKGDVTLLGIYKTYLQGSDKH